jgi:serine/threonine protein kinase
MMNRNKSVEELFEAALELPPERRAAFLDEACQTTPDLRQLVEYLLIDEERMGSFLEKPVLQADPPSLDYPAISDFRSRFQPREVIANRFEVVRFIARGGMGEVYEVRDQFLQDLNVALKIIRPEIASDAGSSRRFEQEVILARKVTHPNLCPIYDIFRCEQPAPPFSFLTMKLLRGETLDIRLKLSGALPAGEALAVCRQLLRGVSALHEGGILHRDLKPNNVMLEPATEQAKERLNVSIMDFGLARLNQLEMTAGQSVTIAGTAGYMAPELLRGQPPSKASDLYALGIVLHQVLTGQRPVESAGGLSLIPLPALRASQAPAHWHQAVEGFVSADPAKRVLAFQQLQAAESGTASATQSSLRSRTIRYAAAAVILLLLIGLAVWLTSPPVPRPLLAEQVTFSREAKERPLLSDGSRLYFHSHGEPSVMAMTGGTIAPLLSLGTGFEIKDVSPDGAKVLALKPDSETLEASSGTIWIAPTLGGAPRRLGSLSGQDMRWSPDGQSILFADKGSVYTVNEDGTNQKKLWEAPGTVDSLGRSPDGRGITWALIDSNGSSRQWQMKADGHNPHPILPDWPQGSDQWFGQWSQGGKHFVFLADRVPAGAAGWRNSDLTQGNVYELIEPRWFEFWKKPFAAILTTNQLDIQGLAPGPDGDSLFVLGQADQGEMFVLDPATGKYIPFLDGLAASGFVISPDRQWMAYSDFPFGRLWKSRLDGSEPTQLTTVPAFVEQWSPDGKSLVYSDGNKLYLISADGGSPEKLIPTGEDEALPSWLPDGKSIAFAYWDGVTHPRKGVPVVDLATHSVSMMPGAEEYYEPSWSPDGKYMVAIADNPSRLVLYTAGTKAWIDLKKFDTPIGFSIWAYDSKSIYFRMLEGLNGVYRLTVPEGVWTRISGLDGLNERMVDSAPSLTVDGRPALMSHTGVAQIYSLHWNH